MINKKFLVTIILTLMMTSMTYGFTPTFHPAITSAIAANAYRCHHEKDTITEEFDKLAWRDDTVMLVHFKYKGYEKIYEQKVRYATKEECDYYKQGCKNTIICFIVVTVVIIIIIFILCL